MIGKAFLFATCVFGAFLQTQSAAIAKNEDAEYKPDIRYVQVEVDDKEFNLTLVQRLHQVFLEKTPVWTIHSSEGENGDEITEVEYSEDKRQINGLFYGDSEFMATLLTSWDKDERQLYYNGVINIGTKIYNVESAVDDWWREPEVSETSNEEIQSSENDEQESEETVEVHESHEQQSEETVEAQESYEQQSKEKIETQELKLRSSYVYNNDDAESLENSLTTLYPKILAVVDYDIFNELGQDVEKVIEYVATFWNAVDLKYSKLNSPNVKIIVTGVLIVKDEHVSLVKGDLNSFNENFVKKTSFVNYDAAFVLSKSSIVTRQVKTHLGSICNRQKSVALVQDDARYEGLASATHELGHLFNLPHDGVDKAEKCTVDSENYTFMTTDVESEKQLTWSQCSRDILQEFVKSKAAACLENYWRYD